MNISIPSEPFEGFGKISRAAKAFGCVITEKIDRTEDFASYTEAELMAVFASIQMMQPVKRKKN